MKEPFETLQEKLSLIWDEIENAVLEFDRSGEPDFYETVYDELRPIREALEEIGRTSEEWMGGQGDLIGYYVKEGFFGKERFDTMSVPYVVLGKGQDATLEFIEARSGGPSRLDPTDIEHIERISSRA